MILVSILISIPKHTNDVQGATNVFGLISRPESKSSRECQKTVECWKSVHSI